MVNSQWSMEVSPQSAVQGLQACVCSRFFLVVLFFALILTPAAAQVPQVPHKMQFAGITLTVRDDAKKEIQKDVDALWQSPKHFNIKVERAKTYFPIIEKVFKEEGVPDDFKYLALQESALIPDAVSVSNAVGFWQFKDFTAIEMGLRVDKDIDERMNIVSASHGAARYFKKNNFYFNNWIYALQAYQMGAGGVMQAVKDSESGATNMEITSKTYWYVKKYLAHKIAFEGAVIGSPQVQVSTYEHKGKKKLSDLAKEISIDEIALAANNKWVKSGFIPDDKAYMILIPVSGNINDIKFPISIPLTNVAAFAGASTALAPINSIKEKKKINGLPTIIAIEGDDPTKLAQRGNVDLSDFLKWNDISISHIVKPGALYFLAKKRARASEAYHHVQSGEDLWSVSQQHGVQLKKLEKYNRLAGGATLLPGETLWLSAKRPKDEGQRPDTKIVEVDNQESFNWSDSLSIIPKVDANVNGNPKAIVITSDNIKQDSVKIPPATQTLLIEPEQEDLILVTPTQTEHIVRAGETLYAIAKLYNIAVMDLVNWNNLDLKLGIKPGQILKLTDDQVVVKNPEKVIPTEFSHVVKANDTLYSVARKYSVTIKEIMEWNGKKDFNVTIGEKLRILR